MLFTDYLQTQPLLRVAVALMLGIIVGDALTGLLPVWVWLAATAGCVVIELLLYDRPYKQSIILLFALFFAGAALVTKKNIDSGSPFDDNVSIPYEAVIVSEPQVHGKVLRCDLMLTSVKGKTLDDPLTVKGAILRDTVDNDWQQLQLGSGIRAMSVMQPLVNYFEGSNFDYVRWQKIHGYRAQTFIYYSDWDYARINLSLLPLAQRMKLRSMKIRNRLISRLHIGKDDDQQAAVVAAMVLGDKHSISRETKDEYSISGASHILALSGLHLGIIYAILTMIFGSGIRSRWLSQAIIIVAVWVYVVIVGMGSSVVRSAVMLTIYSFCLVAERDKASINTLSLAAVCMLVSNPLCLWDVGFQMSFMAVLTIVIFYRHIFGILPRKGELTGKEVIDGPVKWLWGMASVSIAAQIGTAPLVAYYFGRFSCYFLLSNFVVIPFATIIIYGAVAVVATSFLPTVSIVLASLLTKVVLWLNTFVSWVASLPGSCIDNIHINTLQLWLIYIVIVSGCIIYSYLSKLKKLKPLDAFH